MLFAEWFRPPRRVLVLVLSVTALLTLALGTLAWRLFNQERMLEAQRMQERLEQTIDRASAGLLDCLTKESDRLGELVTLALADAQRRASDREDVSSDGLLLLFTSQSVYGYPAHRLLYSPAPDVSPDPYPDVFTAADAAEFLHRDAPKAIGLLSRLTLSAVPAIRAGALLRLARNQRKTGALDAALESYAQLEQLGMTVVSALPAELIARHARCQLLSQRGARERQSREAAALAADLQAGRWMLARGAYLFYLSEARRFGADGSTGDPRALALTEGAAGLWAQWQQIRSGAAGANGERSLWIGDHAVVLVWRSTPERLAGLVADARFIERRWLAASIRSDAVRVGIDGPQGRAIVALPAAVGRLRATRALPTSQLQWNINAADTSPDTEFASRRRLLLAGLALVILLAITGSYAVARAVSRELEVSQLQSDFVAAVSHEFRSPLTTMQQLSEMLVGGRVPGQERRQRYYEVIARETGRLNRLVEDLLDFGRMEAGAQRYRLQRIEVGDLVSKLVFDFQAEVGDRGYRILFDSDGVEASVDADAEALRLAFHNLLDNAVKYSPDSKSIWVAVKSEDGRVSVCVRDAGMGIASADQRRIFRKFVRGSAAKSDGIRGTGLGLAMVRHIVEAHKGDIRLVSELGRGSTFTIQLPLAGGVPGLPSGSVVPESEGG